MTEQAHSNESSKRATVVGCGLIGGSIGLALRRAGWHVSVVDTNQDLEKKAIEIGAADDLGWNADSKIVFVSTEVSQIPEIVKEALSKSDAFVTDVGSAKFDICHQIDDSRFVGGHPMAGSELSGLDGSDVDMFREALWILTPIAETSDVALSEVRRAIVDMGADVVTLPPNIHDRLVAQVSHVPHLVSAALMNMATASSVDHALLLRLAAGGFRDMTRISAGSTSIWPDIVFANRTAIGVGLDQLIDSLSELKSMVDSSDATGLLDCLDKARDSRVNLPQGLSEASNLVEVVIPVLDKPGELATITNTAAELLVNIFNLEVSHSAFSGQGGVVTIAVNASDVDRLKSALIELEYRPTVRPINDLS